MDYVGEDDVLGLDVPVENVGVVHEAEGLTDLPHFLRGLLLSHAPPAPDAAVKGPLLHVLQNEVDVLLLLEAAV